MADVFLTGAGRSFQGELWKPVPSEPGVLVSNMGRVLLPPSFAPMARGGFRIYVPEPRYGERSKASKDAAHEYMHVMVTRRDGVKRWQTPRKVHQLVCEAFHGPRPFDGAVVIHLNEDATDNRAENLKWGTQKENLNMPGYVAQLRLRVGANSNVAISRARKAEAHHG